jgi:hypothetical protein
MTINDLDLGDGAVSGFAGNCPIPFFEITESLSFITEIA